MAKTDSVVEEANGADSHDPTLIAFTSSAGAFVLGTYSSSFTWREHHSEHGIGISVALHDLMTLIRCT